MDAPKVLKGGNKNKKLILVGAVAVGGVFFYEYRKASSGQIASTVDDTPGTDSATDDTGYSAIDSTAGAVGVTPSAQVDAFGNTITTGSGVNTPSVTTNAQWVQAATFYLLQLGYDPVTVATALGKYITGAGLTNDQLGIVQSAIAAQGNPPVTVTPPHVDPPAGQGSGTTTKTPVTTPPPATTKTPVTSAPTAVKKLGAPSVHVAGSNPNGAQLQWTSVPGAGQYMVYRGAIPIKLGTALAITVHVDGQYSVQARQGKTSGPKSNVVTVKGVH